MGDLGQFFKDGCEEDLIKNAPPEAPPKID